ncbi:MAG: helix-turn-helix transcriptional regulator [Bacteroides sp.]
MLNFGERLRRARERKGLTQVDVYRAIGLNNKSLSRYENGATAPDPDTLRDLIRLYDVSADYVLGLSDEMGSVAAPDGSSLVPPKAAEDAALLERLSGLTPEAKEKANEYVEMLKTLDEVKSGENFLDIKKKA